MLYTYFSSSLQQSGSVMGSYFVILLFVSFYRSSSIDPIDIMDKFIHLISIDGLLLYATSFVWQWGYNSE